MGEIYPLLDFLEFIILLTALVLVGLLAYHPVYPIIDRYLPHAFTPFTALLKLVTPCGFFCAGFTLFYCVVMYCHILAFSFHTSYLHCRILSLISYSVMVGFALYVFVRHTADCFLLLVNLHKWLKTNRKPIWIGGRNVR